MSSIGPRFEASIVQASSASQQAARARDRERAKSEAGRKVQDQVDLRIAGVESDQAIRKLPQNDSEQAEAEHRRQSQPQQKEKGGGKNIDLTV